MFLLLSILAQLAGPILIILVVVALARLGGSKPKPDQQSSYDVGYWEGRRRLRSEVMEILKDRDTVTATDVQSVLDSSQWSPDEQPSQPTTTAAHRDHQTVSAPAQPVDYSVGLLYLGAFLFVAAASLFVLLSGVGGSIKTLVVIAVSAAFYCSGIILTRRTQKLAGVGATFAAIGLLLAPLSGIAVYGYWLNQMHGEVVWLITSAACLVLYVHALFSIQKEYVGYMCIGMLVSLVESSFVRLGLNMYFLAWGLMLVGAMSVAMKRIFGNKIDELSQSTDMPLIAASIILVPVALLWSLGLIPQHGVAQFIASGFLAALYYGLYGATLPSGSGRQASWISAQIHCILAGAILSQHLTHDTAVLSIYLVIWALVYTGISFANPVKRYIPRHYSGFFALNIGLLLSTVISVVLWPGWLLLALLITSGIFWLQWWSGKRTISSVLAQLLIVLAPGVLSWYVVRPVAEPIVPASLYMLLAYSWAVIVYGFKVRTQDVRIILVTSYAISAGISLIVALFAPHGFLAALLLAAAMLVYAAAARHAISNLAYIGNLLLYLAVPAVISGVQFGQKEAALGFGWLLLAGLLYASSFMYTSAGQNRVARTSAGAGLLLSALVGLASSPYWYIAPLAITLLALLIFREAWLYQKYWLHELAGATAMVALQLVLARIDIDELLVYTHLWAGLMLLFGLLRRARGQLVQTEVYIWAALTTATVPFALLLLSGASLGYGWLFIAEHTGMTLVGVLYKKANVVWWGLCATILAVLYQLRELQFVALGLLSLFVLAIAVHLTLKHQKAVDGDG